MPAGPRTNALLSRALDALATRFGIALSLGAILGVSTYAAIFAEQGVRAMLANQHLFEDRQSRNGFVSLSDVQRLNLAAFDALQEGEVSDETALRFERALDILHVRADSFRQTLSPELRFPSGIRAIEGLERLVEIGDAAVANEFADVDGMAAEISVVSDETRGDLAIWNDALRRMQFRLLAEKSTTITSLRQVLWISLVGLTCLGGGALLLLRREVLGRNARERAERRVEYLAYFDALTTLPNRVQFKDRMKGLLARGDPMTLLLVDLDHFKAINDTYGHAAGDATLRHVAKIIEKRAREAGGFAARLGGDEFAIVIGSELEQTLRDFGDAILSDVAEGFWFDGETLRVSVSIGGASSAHVSDRTALTVDTLTRVTDFALYAAKHEGRNRCSFYDSALEARYNERRAIVEELPRAIADGDLAVFLQPKVAIEDGRVYGFEALVRWWRHDALVPPGDFISLAEESGHVVEIDAFVLARATKIVADWNRRHGTQLSISVNLSAHHFSSTRIISTVRKILDGTDLPPELLTLEITETVQLRDWAEVRRILTGLRALGCRIAVDDFGTGFSSMAYLRAISADELKIDRSLVNEIEISSEARFIFDAVLDLAANLQMSVVVEGIETAEQARTVADLGGRFAQGHYFGPPRPAAEALLAANVTLPHSA